jgi:TP901 family phage tail tape measure protein
MTSNLTAVWQSFGFKTDEELTHVAAAAARLGADSAIAFKDVVTGMKQSASAAALLGVSYDQLAAMITTIGDTTQLSASVIDTSLKTMFARIIDLKEGGPGAVDEDGIGLGRIGEQLAELGYSAFDAEGALKPLGDIITQLGNNWENMSIKQQMATA